MRKIMYFAAMFATLIACTKETPENGSEDNGFSKSGTSFKKGQVVTLTVCESKTKATGFLNKDNGVDFKWDEGDQIKVSIGSESSTFTLKSGAGSNSAVFEGTMPASGDTFDVQYPASDPDLTAQIYVENGLPKGMMKATASGCTINGGISLAPQYSALRLYLYGLDRKVTSIEVTNTTANPNEKYVLTCSTSVKVGTTSDKASPFLVVVPAGTYAFKVNVSADAVSPAKDTPAYIDGTYSGFGVVVSTGSFSTNDTKVFTAGEIRNMSAKAITADQIWAPVNCGYDATNYPYGLCYQWGRPYGHYENMSSKRQTITKEQGLSEEYKDILGLYNQTYSDNWYAGDVDNTLWSDSGKGTYDPCPDGWRVPNKTECEAMSSIGGIPGSNRKGDGSEGGTISGFLIGTAPYQFFLPTGYFVSYTTGTLDHVGTYYWTSSVSGNRALFLNFMPTGPNSFNGVMNNVGRACCYFIRCVKE